MKVAQYEVLGTDAKKEMSVPQGTIDEYLQSPSRLRDQKPSISIVPNGTTCFLLHFPALRTGLLS